MQRIHSPTRDTEDWPNHGGLHYGATKAEVNSDHLAARPYVRLDPCDPRKYAQATPTDPQEIGTIEKYVLLAAEIDI